MTFSQGAGRYGRVLYQVEWSKKQRFKDRSHLIMGPSIMGMGGVLIFLGIIVGIAESYATAFIGHAVGMPIAFLLLVVAMFWRPYGLWGRVRIERV